jgi:hypothetical protein
MDERPKKRRGPITLLSESRRLRWTLALSLTVVVLAIAVDLFRSQFRNLKGRVSLISAGMTRAEVESILGRPELSLDRAPPGTGELLVWVDQLWQVEVVLDGDGLVVRSGCVPSDSFLQRTVYGRPSPVVP